MGSGYGSRPVEHGEVELRVLCDRFLMSYYEVTHDFREYKESQGKLKPVKLRQLMNHVNMLPISTACCERGFSKMNVVCTSLRTRLTVKHMASLLFISLAGPPLNRWEPLPYVKTWLARNRRDANCTNCPKSSGCSVDKGDESLWNMFIE